MTHIDKHSEMWYSKPVKCVLTTGIIATASTLLISSCVRVCVRVCVCDTTLCKKYISYKKNSAVAEIVAQCCTTQSLAFDWGYFSLTHPFSLIFENIAIAHILPKCILCVTFLAQCGSSFNCSDVIIPRICRIRWNRPNAEYRPILRSRVINFIPMKSCMPLPMCA